MSTSSSSAGGGAGGASSGGEDGRPDDVYKTRIFGAALAQSDPRHSLALHAHGIVKCSMGI